MKNARTYTGMIMFCFHKAFKLFSKAYSISRNTGRTNRRKKGIQGAQLNKFLSAIKGKCGFVSRSFETIKRGSSQRHNFTAVSAMYRSVNATFSCSRQVLQIKGSFHEPCEQ